MVDIRTNFGLFHRSSKDLSETGVRVEIDFLGDQGGREVVKELDENKTLTELKITMSAGMYPTNILSCHIAQCLACRSCISSKEEGKDTAYTRTEKHLRWQPHLHGVVSATLR